MSGDGVRPERTLSQAVAHHERQWRIYQATLRAGEAHFQQLPNGRQVLQRRLLDVQRAFRVLLRERYGLHTAIEAEAGVTVKDWVQPYEIGEAWDLFGHLQVVHSAWRAIGAGTQRAAAQGGTRQERDRAAISMAFAALNMGMALGNVADMQTHPLKKGREWATLSLSGWQRPRIDSESFPRLRAALDTLGGGVEPRSTTLATHLPAALWEAVLGKEMADLDALRSQAVRLIAGQRPDGAERSVRDPKSGKRTKTWAAHRPFSAIEVAGQRIDPEDSEALTPEAFALREEQRRAEQRALSKLGPAMAKLAGEQRRVVELSFFEGLTLQEIASRTGKALGTVKATKHQALRRLRGILRDEKAV